MSEKQASEEYYITKENIRNPEIIKKKIAESKKSLKAKIDAIKEEKIQKRRQIIDDARKDISLSKISKKSWKTSRNNRVHPI